MNLSVFLLASRPVPALQSPWFWLEIAGSALGAFFLGSIPFGYLAVKLFKGQDIRKTGSGNIGASNAARVLGKWGFALVFLLDALKGFGPTLLAVLLFGTYAGIASAAGAMLGHIFTPWLGFKGGKGIATGVGGFAALTPLGALVALGTWALCLLLTRYVSVSSLVAAFAMFLFVTFVQEDMALSVFCGLGVLVVWFTHRSNMKRLLRGEEPRVSFKRKDKDAD